MNDSPLKRKVFYIPGFDPRSEAHYKKLLLTEFPEIKDNLRFNKKDRIVFQKDDLEIDYEILSWHNQVKQNWAVGVFENLGNVYTIFKESLIKGAYYRLFHVCKKSAFQKTFISYLFAIWFVLFLLGLWEITQRVLESHYLFAFFLTVAFVLLNVFVYYILDKLNMFWVARVMNFFVVYSNEESPSIAEIENKFKHRIEQVLKKGEYDEIVLISHSVGTILCLSVFADLVLEQKDNRLTVITLGHCVTGVNMIKSSKWYLDKMRRLENRKALWVDIASGKDAVAFYKINPAHFVESKPDITISAGFHRIFKKEFYKSLKWRFYAIHFLYLVHPDFPEKSVFNYSKLLFDEQLILNLKKMAPNHQES